MLTAVFIGSGNIAGHLSKAFFEKGIEIRAVHSRNLKTGKEVAAVVNSVLIPEINALPSDADLYLLAVNDDAITEISEKLDVQGLVAHCSGIKELNVLGKHAHHGVFYPLQTFVKDSVIDLKTVPVCIEAGSEEDLRILEAFADRMGGPVHFINSEQRQYLHLAAVLANNFSNHLFVLAKNICDEHGMNFDLLKPLIMKTAQNLRESDPMQNQTGPAKRDDRTTIEKHLELSGNNDDLKTLYKIMTESIRKLHNK